MPCQRRYVQVNSVSFFLMRKCSLVLINLSLRAIHNPKIQQPQTYLLPLSQLRLRPPSHRLTERRMVNSPVIFQAAENESERRLSWWIYSIWDLKCLLSICPRGFLAPDCKNTNTRGKSHNRPFVWQHTKHFQPSGFHQWWWDTDEGQRDQDMFLNAGRLSRSGYMQNAPVVLTSEAPFHLGTDKPSSGSNLKQFHLIRGPTAFRLIQGK